MNKQIDMNIYKWFKLIGIITAIGYMVIILEQWILANHQGYTYFQAGEPNMIIMYTEWVLGIIAVITLADTYKKEIESI